MLGLAIFLLPILFEISFAILCFTKKSTLRKERAITGIVLFALILIVAVTPLIEWNIWWYALGLLLLIQAISGAIVLLRRREFPAFRKGKTILNCLGGCLLVGIVMSPALLSPLLFPRYSPIMPTGEYAIGTASYTWTDESREETFTPDADRRHVTVQFWYPAGPGIEKNTQVAGAGIADGSHPLVVFSHGAFGYRLSNHSTYMELASHGYVVASIDHPYHAFFTRQVDGSTVIADTAFLNEAMQVSQGKLGALETYEASRDWLEIRKADMAFVLARIQALAASAETGSLFQGIDLEHIGVFGHSLGGATAAQIGREFEEVGAVIVLDGTMLGEQVGFENGKEVISDVPYPKPIMNLYNESHYADAMAERDTYANTVAQANAVDAYQVVVNGSGHLNFTDLPLVSPALAGLLGTGEVDARSCITTTNAVVLQFFDRYLKTSGVEIPREQVF